jgi:pimeloyl-ACP methyl ester carboxylesterase
LPCSSGNSGSTKRKIKLPNAYRFISSVTDRILASLIVLFAALVSANAHAREAPTMVELPTKSVIATWTFAAATGSSPRLTPVIFLHGGPGLYTEDRRIEQGQVFRQAGFTTVFYDQVGSGQSKQLVATEYSLNRMIDDLEALRVHLGATKLVLWGNSWGSQLAVLYARKFPDRVGSLILTSPGIFPGFSARRDYSPTKRGSVNVSNALSDAVDKIDDKAGLAEAQVSQIASGRLFDELAATELLSAMVCRQSNIGNASLSGGGNLFVNRMVQKEVAAFKGSWDSAPKVPSIVIRGGCDYIPTTSAERYAQVFKARLVEISDSGHALLEDPVSIDRALQSFIANELKDLP